MGDVHSDAKRKLHIEALKGMGNVEELIDFLKPPRNADEVVLVVSLLLNLGRLDESEAMLATASELVDNAIYQELLNTITIRRMIK